MRKFRHLWLLSVLTACQLPANPGAVSESFSAPLSAQGFQAAKSPYRTSLKVEPQRLIYAATTPPPTMGQILVGRGPESDFVRKVVGHQIQNAQLVVDTLPANLYDAFPQLQAQGFQAESTVRKPLVFDALRIPLGKMATLVTTVRLDPDFSDSKVELRDKKLFVRLAPTTQISSENRLDFTLFNWPTTQNTELPALQTAASVSLPGLTIPGWIGPIPVVYHVKPEVVLDWAARGSGNFTFGPQLKGRFMGGLEIQAAWGEKPTTRTFSDHQFETVMAPPTLNLRGSAHMRVSVPQVQFDLKIAGITGPYIKAGPYVQGHASETLQVNPNGSTLKTSVLSQVGLAIKGGITETTVFGYTLNGGLHLQILDKVIKELYRRDITQPLP